MTITKKRSLAISLLCLAFCQARAENAIDPLRYIYGTWRCNHYDRWSIGGNLNEDQLGEIVSSKLHVEKNGKKGRIYLKGTEFGGEIIFNPAEVTVRQLFDSEDDSYGFELFSFEKHPLRFMFNECRLGEFNVIFFPVEKAIVTVEDNVWLGEMYLYRETLILNYIDRSTLFMEKRPHSRQTYKGTKSDEYTFLIPENTSFILLSYEVEDIPATITVKAAGAAATAKKDKPKNDTLFSVSAAGTRRGTKTTRIYVAPELERTNLTVSVRTGQGQGKWRVRMEAY